MIYKQKGAMFGLDARIALAIFGALSVITGASLYSAIQDSKVVSIVTEMDNVEKAVTAYYLDTGVFPGESAAGSNLLKTRELVANTAAVGGWLGPYLTFEDGATANMLDHTIYGEIAIYRNVDDAGTPWSDGAAAGSKCLSGSTTCSVYICYTGLSDDLQKAIDVKVDGSASGTTGNFRYISAGAACKKGLLYDKNLAPAV